MTEHSAGAVLDPLGLLLELEADQQVIEVLIIAKVAGYGDDTRTALLYETSPGLDWIAQRGLLSAATHLLDTQGLEDQDGD